MAIGFVALTWVWVPLIQADPLYSVNDSSDRAELWAFQEDAPLSESDAITLLFQGPEQGNAIVVLKAGTEAFRLPDSAFAAWSNWRTKHEPIRLGKNPGFEGHSETTSLWRYLSQTPRQKILEWTLWPTGLEIEVKSMMNALPETKPTGERQLNFSWSQSFFRFGFAEVGIHRSQWGGGVTLPLRPGELDFFTNVETPPNYWDDPDWWWHFALGGPVAQFEMRSQGGIAPSYLVMDRKASTQAKRHQDGPILNWFNDEKSHSGNTSQAIHLRFYHLRYSFIWDMDAYQVAVMHLGMEEIPFGFGQLNFGMWSAADVFMSEIGVDLQPSPVEIPVPGAWRSLLTVTPLHLNFMYYDKKQFQFSLSTRIHLNNRIFRLPGGAP